MSATLGFLGLFGDAIDFIVQPRESVSGGVQIGGPGEMLDLAATHIAVSAVAIVGAVVLFIPFGLFLGHRGRGEFLASSVSNVGRAVPTLALLAFFLSFLGIGFTNVAFVLFLLAVPPIFTNTFVGVSQVDKDTVDAAKGMGLTDFQVVRHVELPLALPTIFAGVRLSTVAVLATATIGPLANVFTLGTPIIEPQTYGPPGQLAAALLVAIVTVLGDQIVRLIQRLVTPAGIRLDERGPAKPSKKKRLTLNPLRRERTT